MRRKQKQDVTPGFLFLLAEWSSDSSMPGTRRFPPAHDTFFVFGPQHRHGWQLLCALHASTCFPCITLLFCKQSFVILQYNSVNLCLGFDLLLFSKVSLWTISKHWTLTRIKKANIENIYLGIHSSSLLLFQNSPAASSGHTGSTQDLHSSFSSCGLISWCISAPHLVP